MRLTINLVLWAAIVALAALLSGLYVHLDRSSTAWVDESSNQLRQSASSRASADIEKYLGQGREVVLQLEAQIRAGDCEAAESCLMAALIGNPNLAEVTLTRAVDQGFDEEGDVKLAEEGRRQTSVFRATARPDAEVCTREVSKEGTAYVARTRCRAPQKVLTQPGMVKTGDAIDPTRDFAFSTPAMEGKRNRTIMTDLAYSQLDEQLPEDQRRVVLIALRGIEDDQQKLLGVLKVGLLEAQVTALALDARVNLGDPDDPYRIFIADEQGRLISGLDKDDRPVEDGDDLRIKPKAVPPAVKAALEHPKLAEVTDDTDSSGDFMLDGRRFRVSFHMLAQTWGWRIGIVGPEDYYLGTLKKQREDMLLWMGGVFALVFVGGAVAARVLRRALSQIQHETTGMSRFNFSAAPVRSGFAEVRDALFSLEQAKTAVRAMGKYVPMALVQTLFKENREPSLGGALREVTIFFSDIEGFTTRAEEEPPDVVAKWLGSYLEVMTTAVHAEQGTVDKFIGDSVMALWNAPTANEEHAVQACRAALRCQQETQKLFASQQWAGRAPLVTRIGLHVGSVMVGHFGAPDRLSYTAIGDSVNLASRLEGLNKQYGTTLLVSEEVQQRARHKFAFRRLDLVAVKGKSQAIGIYELLGAVDQPGILTDEIRRYELALELYVKADFAGARALLLQSPKDPPSVVLAARCAELERHPPAAPWAGISFAQSK